MVEACNLRGEALRVVRDDPDLGFEKFKGLIDRSIERAKKLKALPVLARNYNFTTAVIGRSVSAENSVRTLAEAGFEVFWFSTPGGDPLPKSSHHPNVHRFNDAVVTRLSGTVGEFQISFDLDGATQTLQVGAVILGEKARKTVKYILQEGLPSFTVKSGRQKQGIPKIPFFYPGATSIPGLFVSDSPGVYVSKRRKGAAVAVQAAAIMPRGPRQSKGLTVVVDGTLCRGCGRCINKCPYQAITLSMNEIQGWYASVDEALCKGCGNCISVCPSNAADSPYRNQAYLEETLEGLLAG
jgi:heterodisulfide reductase subunit A-like polyferredoxin